MFWLVCTSARFDPHAQVFNRTHGLLEWISLPACLADGVSSQTAPVKAPLKQTFFLQQSQLRFSAHYWFHYPSTIHVWSIVRQSHSGGGGEGLIEVGRFLGVNLQ